MPFSAGEAASATPADHKPTRERVETLMGRRPELRFALICEHARFVADSLDV